MHDPLFKRSPALLVLTLLAGACGGQAADVADATRPAPAQQSAPSRIAAGPADGAPQDAPLVGQQADDPPAGQQADEPNGVPTEIEAERAQVALESDEEFLTRSRPRPDPAAYRNWRERKKIHVGQSHLSHADLSPDEKLLLVISGNEATVRIYDAASGRLVANHEIPGFARFDRGSAMFWPDAGGEPAFVFASTSGIELRDARSGGLLARLSDTPAWRLGWSPDRRYLVSVASEIPAQRSVVTFFRALPGRRLEQLAEVPFPERVDGLALSADNRLMAYLTYPGDELVLHDLFAGERRWAVQAPRYANGVDISPDGALVAAGGAALMLVAAADPARRAYASEFGNNICQARFSPAGDAVAASSYDGRVRIFAADLSSPHLKQLKALRHAGTANVYSVLFLADGSGLWSSSGDMTMRRFGR